MDVLTGIHFFYGMFAYLIYYNYICCMKPMLIDNISSYHSTQSCEKLKYEGQLYEHWCIAKPYSQRFGFKTRVRHAILVLMGKAVAVQYFKDLSDEEKTEELLKNGMT